MATASTPRPAPLGAALAALAALAACSGGGGEGSPVAPVDGGCLDCAPPDGGPPDAGRLPTGARCDLATDCTSGLCLRPPQGEAPTCEEPCARAADCGDPGEWVCRPTEVDDDADGVTDTLRGVCAERRGAPLGGACAIERECAAGRCQQAQCTEPCLDDADCLLGQRCGAWPEPPPLPTSLRVCGYTPIDAPTLERLSLGTVSTELFDTFTTPPVGIAPDAVSATFVAERRNDVEATLAFSRVVGPAGGPVLRYEEILAFRDPPLRWIATDDVEVAAVTIPNTTADRLLFAPGRWTAAIVPFGPTGGATGQVELEVTLEVKRMPGGELPTASLDLDVYLVGVGIAAADAPADPRLSGAIDGADALFAQVGLALGEVRYHDVPATVAEALAVVDSLRGPESELATLFRLGVAQPSPSIDVFLVRDLQDDSGVTTLGIAGNIPGPPRHGASTSGVAIAADTLDDADALGKVLAHELGHYLGLFHVRERLDACPAGTGPTAEAPCAPFGGGDVLEDTTPEIVEACPAPCDDARQFVMFWSLQRREDRSRVFSAGQGFVMRRHPRAR